MLYKIIKTDFNLLVRVEVYEVWKRVKLLVLKDQSHDTNIFSEGRYFLSRDGNFKLLRISGIDSASLRSQAGRYDNPIPTRFLAPIDSLKIPALLYWHSLFLFIS